MADQPRVKAQGEARFFDDGIGSRPPVAGTVPRGHLNEDDAFFRGVRDGGPIAVAPVSFEMDDLHRGRQRYDIFCAPCHSRTGDGDGMIVRRGFPRPPSLHEQRLREAPDGHLFNVIGNGFGRMPAYDNQLPPADRWPVVAYLRALQLSRQAVLNDVPDVIRSELEAQR
jgi:mono/diheme cytochrome c family protein